MSVTENLIKIKNNLPPKVKLVAVSKTKPVNAILEAYELGQRLFGENKVQEVAEKYNSMPKDIEWHMIGHLQTNKVKFIAPFISLIHSVDSLKLLKEIDREGNKNKRVINCLFQFHIAEEETKFGLNFEEAVAVLESDEFANMKNVKIIGVMGMATFTENEMQIKKEFSNLKKIFDNIRNKYFNEDPGFCEISMGMSDDYHLAIEEGATLVRLGSTIFGLRV